MAHHGHHGYTSTKRVKQIRQERAGAVAYESPYTHLNGPEAKLAYLDEHFPQGANRQRRILKAQIASAKTTAAKGQPKKNNKS